MTVTGDPHGSLRTHEEDGVLEVTLDRPKANAIDLATSRAMGEVFAGFRDDPALRVAILRTAGEKFFSAGWDLKAAAAGDPVDGDYGVGGFGGLQELPGLDKPVIAAVHGLAMGGGFELALSCDLIYASEATQFGLPEINAGTLADAATNKLPKRMPYHVAMELLLTGRWMPAAEAARWGVVNEVLPDEESVRARAWETARLLAAGPPLVFAALPGGPGPGHQQHPAGRRQALLLRGRPRGLQGLRREAQARVEGSLTPAQSLLPHPLRLKRHGPRSASLQVEGRTRSRLSCAGSGHRKPMSQDIGNPMLAGVEGKAGHHRDRNRGHHPG
jgi:crotonobetainyl-CoA hydratase